MKRRTHVHERVIGHFDKTIDTDYKGGKRVKTKQKLKRAYKNPEKVTLGWIGELEVYCYPYQFPDTVFIGHYPFTGTKLDKYEIRQLGKAWIRSRSYLSACFKKRGTSARRELNKRLLRAYNYSLEHINAPKKMKFSNSITSTTITKPSVTADWDKKKQKYDDWLKNKTDWTKRKKNNATN